MEANGLQSEVQDQVAETAAVEAVQKELSKDEAGLVAADAALNELAADRALDEIAAEMAVNEIGRDEI